MFVGLCFEKEASELGREYIHIYVDVKRSGKALYLLENKQLEVKNWGVGKMICLFMSG